MKKILIEASPIAQEQKTGVGYFSEQLAGALEKAGQKSAQVSYLWLNFLGRRNVQSKLLQNARSQGRLHEFRIISQKIYAKLVYAKFAPPLVTKKVDWVLFPNFYLWPTVGPDKKAVVIHDMCFLRYPEYVEDKNQKFLASVAVRAVQNADLIITVSEFTKHELISLVGVAEEKILAIDIPVDEKDFLPTNNRGVERLKQRYNIHKKYILTLGTIEPRKNIPLLVESYVQLPSEIRGKYSLVLAGKWGWKTEAIKALIEGYQKDGFDIITTSYIDNDDKSTLYRNASVYALTTFYEGFGMPLLEAMYCGLPTVATDIPVLREVAGEDACLWSGFNVEQFSKQLETVLSEPQLASTLAAKAKQRADSYSWESTALKVLERLN